jgi:hypothetical protein
MKRVGRRLPRAQRDTRRQLTGQDFDDQPLDIIGIDAGERSGPSPKLIPKAGSALDFDIA